MKKKQNAKILSLALALSLAIPLSAAAEVLIYPDSAVQKISPVYGRLGIFSQTDLNNNDVTIRAGGTDVLDVFGGVSSSPSVILENNKVTIDGANVLGHVHGGFSQYDGSAINNTVIINNSNIGTGMSSGSIYGGVAPVTISGNIVEITNSTFTSVLGAYSQDAVMNNNKVSVVGSTARYSVSAARGYGNAATANGNTIYIKDTTVNGNIFGVEINGGSAENNIVTIDGNTNAAFVYGTLVTFSGSAKNNIVNILDGTLTHIYGGRANGTDGNKVNISGGSVQYVYGGFGGSGSAINNEVNISGGSIGGMVYGGRLSTSGNVSGNRVNISGTASLARDLAGGSNGGTATTDHANDNYVTITGGTIQGNIYGGKATAGESKGNIVTIIDTAINSNVSGGDTFNGNSFDNIVNISGTTSFGSLATIIGGVSTNGNSYNNTVNLSGTASFDNNTSIIARGCPHGIRQSMASFDNNTSIIGGYSGNANVYGNILNSNWQGSLGSIANFEYINITIPATAQPTGTIFDTAAPSDLAGSNIKIVGMEDSAITWKGGDSITLFNNFQGAPILHDSTVRHGLTNTYDFKMAEQGSDIIAYIEANQNVAKQERSLVEGYLAGTSFLNTGIDFMLDAGMNNMREELNSKGNLFAALGYSKDKFKTASNADISGTNFILGSMKTLNTKNSRSMLGGFVEAGWGKYNTRDSFGDSSDINANGNTNYYGAGIVGHQEFNNGTYLEGSLRVGRASSSYNSTDLNQVVNIDTRYDVKSTYYGGHIGAGKIIKLNEKNDLDLYGKYLYLHRNGATTKIGDDTLELQGINSNRLRAGARIHHKNTTQSTTSFGLAYEYELSAEGKGNANHLEILPANIKGGTLIAEVGIVHRPKNQDKFSMKLGLQGYTGRRQGFSGNAHFKWEF